MMALHKIERCSNTPQYVGRCTLYLRPNLGYVINTVHCVSCTLASMKLPVKANVAIAAAVTSYARIHMMDLKLNYDVCYSDTDSIFTTHPLPDHLIGSELGQLKDELGGTVIDKAYFLGLKQYTYTYRGPDGSSIDKSV